MKRRKSCRWKSCKKSIPSTRICSSYFQTWPRRVYVLS